MATVRPHVGIPCVDLERAERFYAGVVQGVTIRNGSAPFPMAYVTDTSGHEIGHLFVHGGFPPSDAGVIVYLDCGDITETLARVVQFGGRVTLPKTLIAPGKGYWALFLDTEGNRMALHANQ